MIITLNELKQIIDTDKSDDVIQMKISAVESFICNYTNNQFTDKRGNKNYPPDVKSGAVKLIEWELYQNKFPFVKSESISRYSVSYADADCSNFVLGYPERLTGFLIPYMKGRF